MQWLCSLQRCAHLTAREGQINENTIYWYLLTTYIFSTLATRGPPQPKPKSGNSIEVDSVCSLLARPRTRGSQVCSSKCKMGANKLHVYMLLSTVGWFAGMTWCLKWIFSSFSWAAIMVVMVYEDFLFYAHPFFSKREHHRHCSGVKFCSALCGSSVSSARQRQTPPVLSVSTGLPHLSPYASKPV